MLTSGLRAVAFEFMFAQISWLCILAFRSSFRQTIRQTYSKPSKHNQQHKTKCGSKQESQTQTPRYAQIRSRYGPDTVPIRSRYGPDTAPIRRIWAYQGISGVSGPYRDRIWAGGAAVVLSTCCYRLWMNQDSKIEHMQNIYKSNTTNNNYKYNRKHNHKLGQTWETKLNL